MGSRSPDDVLLLSRPDPFEAEMARELLLANGIPSRLEGGRAHGQLVGYEMDAWLARGDLFVPWKAFERAREILQQAWDRSALSDEIALAAAPVQEPVLAGIGARRIGRMLLVLAILAVVLLVVRDYL